MIFVRNVIGDYYSQLNSKFNQLDKCKLFNEEAMILKALKQEGLYFPKGTIVIFKVTCIENKMIRGKIGDHLNALLMISDIGSLSKNMNLEGKLSQFFSINEKIPVIVKQIIPSIFRVDVSLRDDDILEFKKSVHQVQNLQKIGLDPSLHFQIDLNSDFPKIELFNFKFRNFEFCPFEHELLRNRSMKEIRDEIKISSDNVSFLFKPSARESPFQLDFVLFYKAIIIS